ncbi:hypothetical protein DF3PB_50037 [uncultured Defluviicoccus sp.]|uniref:Uncharacterized protein n=1 Tax=metagenome TaxID=256318 RepID=A0A380TIC7_9ZZZZ|nr:hypothetical protein DF3PB_50037 [uncultured Defluviicoccus sp.]
MAPLLSALGQERLLNRLQESRVRPFWQGLDPAIRAAPSLPSGLLPVVVVFHGCVGPEIRFLKIYTHSTAY